MARRNLNHKLLDSVDISVNQTQTKKTNVDTVDQSVINVSWTGTAPVGTITIEASNSTDNDFTLNAEVWETLDFGSAITVSGNTGSHQLVFTSLPFKFLRFVYTSTSGTGSLTAHINAASLGN